MDDADDDAQFPRIGYHSHRRRTWQLSSFQGKARQGLAGTDTQSHIVGFPEQQHAEREIECTAQ